LKRGYVFDELENSFVKPSKKTNEAFEGEVRSHELAIIDKNDPLVQMEKKRITLLLEKYLKKFNGVKFSVGFRIKFVKPGYEYGKQEKVTQTQTSKSSQVTQKSETRKALKNHKEDILRKIDRYPNQGSGWTIGRIKNHSINMYTYKPLKGQSYIPLPKSIQNRKATVNIKNKDDKCFIYCLGRRFDPIPQKDHLESVTNI